jgi:CRISPR-associated endonuclease Csn1
LRAEALERALTPHELGRALFHLNQRRGFKSNRKADRKNKEDGKIAEGAKRLRERLASENARTLGEFLWRRQNKTNVAQRLPARIRLQGLGAKALYEFYPTREMIEDEFGQIWRAQAQFAPDVVTAEKGEAIHRVLFRQRPLKPPKVGFCTLVEGEQRLPKALPSVEARVIYETLNHIEIGAKARKLDLGERNALATVLLSGKNMTMGQIRKALKLPADQKINFEEGGRDKLEGAKSAWALGEKGPIGKAWAAWPLDRKDEFVWTLLTEADEFALVEILKRDFTLTEDQAARAAAIVPEEGYARLGPTANAAILAELIADVIPYSEAVVRAGKRRGENWHHSDERDGEILKPLPYYPEVLGRHIIPGDGVSEDTFQRLGRIANPTVHICLNQLRRIVNDLVATHGQPDEIVLELARDLKNSLERRKEIEADNRRNREAAEKRTQKLIELGQPDTGENRARLRMFEEQERAGAGVARCPYTLRAIGLTDLFSSEVDIDHVLPMSRTLDDGRANRLLCFREANRVKRNQTPWEAFGNGWTTAKGERVEWSAITANADTLPKGARWRFLPDAMERFNADGRDFLARQLNETRYLSRLAKAYLSKSCNPDNVWVVTGLMIGLLRGKWGMNDLFADHNHADLSPEAEEKARKDRNDHRHHAIDAIVIGAMTRGLVNEIARRAGQATDRDERLFAGLEPPFPEFRQAARAALDKMTVSHKPEHRTTAALHEDTAYGFIRGEKEAREIGNLVRRKPIDSLTGPEVDAVRDPVLRRELGAIRAPFADGKGKVKDAKAFQQALKAFGEERQIRRIRVGKADQSIVAIGDRHTGETYKALVPGENHHMDIVQMRDGSWKGFAATYFEINRKDWRPRWEAERTGGKLVMRVHKGDTIELVDTDGVRRIKTIVRLSPSNNILYLVRHTDAGDFQKRHDDPDDAFRWDFANVGKLRERGAVAVRVDEIGRVRRRKSNIS